MPSVHRLKNLSIHEVSSVTRGAGEGVTVKLIKRADGGGDSAKPGNIVDKALSLAINSILTDEATDAVGKAAALSECFKQFAAIEQPGEDPMPTIAELKKALDDARADAISKMAADHSAYFKTLTGEAAEQFVASSIDERTAYVKAHPLPVVDADAEAMKALEKLLGPELAKLVAKAAKKKPFPPQADDDEDEDDTTKALQKADAAIIETVAKVQGENVELKKQVEALTGAAQKTEFAKRATDIGLSAADGDMLLKAHKGDPEALKKMEDKIKALATQVEKAGLFSEIGDNRGGGPLSAHDELVAKAAEIRKTEPKLTVEQAYAKAMEQNPEISKREESERMAKLQKVAA